MLCGWLTKGIETVISNRINSGDQVLLEPIKPRDLGTHVAYSTAAVLV